MLLTQKSPFYSSLNSTFVRSESVISDLASFQVKRSYRKCSSGPTKVNFLTSAHDNVSNNNRLRKKCGKSMSVLNNEGAYRYFRRLQHPLESRLPLLDVDHDEGIGIFEFFEGKNIFITGGTGLLGKAFVEKLLRSTSVGKIYLLIKAEDNEAAVDRLTKEIINSDLFKLLQDKHGNDYQTFVTEKLIAVAGNICEPNLAMNIKSLQEIMKDVHVIVHSAASTIFNDRYDSLIDINVNAPLRLLRCAKKTCKNFKLFVHISTAYVCGRKEGLIKEKPLIMGQNGSNVVEEDDYDLTSMSLSPRLVLTDETSLALRSCKASQELDFTKHFMHMGQERANLFGYYNTYHLTKALSEMAIDEIRGDMPVLIVRPTCIESTYKDPFPGWIQGNKCFDPVIISYGKGQLPAFLADPQEHMDIIPLDFVVNSTIAAIAKHGSGSKPQLSVHHVASGVVNPLRFEEFFEILHDYFNSKRSLHDESVPKIKLFDNYRELSKHIRDAMLLHGHINGTTDAKLHKRSKVIIAYAEKLCQMYGFIGFVKGRFHTGNTEKLLEEMSNEEKLNFEIDATKIDWRKYFMETHIPGLEKYILNKPC